MTIPWGRGRANKVNCTPRDMAQSITRLQEQIDVLIELGAVDAFTVLGDTDDTTPGTLAEKIENPSTFDSEAHQLVYRETIDTDGVLTQQLFTDKGVGAGDNFTFKIDASSTAGFLEAKIHVDSWVTAAEIASTPSLEYGVGDFFTVFMADTASDTAVLYAPYNIIKTSSGDVSPGYMGEKFADLGTFDGDDHIPCLAEDTGSTMRIFTAKSDIITLIEASGGGGGGGLRFCKVTPNDVGVATESSGDIVPGTCAEMDEFVYNPSTGRLELGDPLDNIVYPSLDPVYVSTGRFKIGFLTPLAADPTKLALRVDCRSFEE